MITCLADNFFAQTGVATVGLLRRLGVQVDFPSGQTCCGQPHFNSGHRDDAREIARYTIGVFRRCEKVVTPSASCAAMVKLEYPEFFADEPHWRKKAESLAGRTHELSGFLLNVLGVEDVGARYPAKATYHMACHLRGLGLEEAPLRLLRHVRDLELLPLERFDECCGFGGSFCVRFPEISAAMVRDKAKFIEATGADTAISTDAGCLMNIGGYMSRAGKSIRMVHLAEVLAAT
jgi:L-lactate dehydrogenase complex protein LldE